MNTLQLIWIHGCLTGAGTYLVEQTLAESTCGAGFYQTKINKTDCICCHPGHYCPQGATAPILCPRGTYQPSSAQCTDRCECIPCGKGEYQDEPGQSSCKCCKIGHRCPNPTMAPIPCEPGTVQIQNRCPERRQCSPAGKGYYQPDSGQSLALCCPDGFRCPNETTVQPEPCQPIPCDVGTAQPSSGRTTCADCADGYYQNGTGQELCLSCPSGHTCINKGTPEACSPGSIGPSSGRTNCDKCTQGYYQDKSSQTQCICCLEGHQCQKTHLPPVPCEPGMYSSGTSYCDGSRYQCYQCARGYYQEKAGQTECFCCPPGHHCPHTERLPIPCGSGTIQSENTCCENRYRCSRLHCRLLSRREWSKSVQSLSRWPLLSSSRQLSYSVASRALQPQYWKGSMLSVRQRFEVYWQHHLWKLYS